MVSLFSFYSSKPITSKATTTTRIIIIAALFNMMIIKKVVSEQQQCVQEFDNCVINRDCCTNLKCITGDWQYTTDSTCLSPRSEQIDNMKLSREEKIRKVETFYNQDEIMNYGVEKGGEEEEEERKSNKKSRKEIEKIVIKYDQEFPKLISRLEAKYGILVDFGIDDNGHGEL